MAKAELTQIQEDLAITLYKTGAFKTGAFKLKLHETQPDAPLSPYKISMRLIDMDGDTDREKGENFEILCEDMVNAIHKDTKPKLGEIQHVAGVPKAGEPIATEFAATTRMHLLTI